MSEVEPAVAQAVEKRDCGKAKVEDWNVKREASIGTTWTLRIKDDWTPTPKNINALPEPLRAYIHDLKTVCDPAGDVTELFRLSKLRTECCGGNASGGQRKPVNGPDAEKQQSAN